MSNLKYLLLSIGLLCGSASGFELFNALPPEVADANWERTPFQVLMNPHEAEPLIWIGAIEGFEIKEGEEGLQLEWLCRHLTFADNGPEAIRGRPIAVLDSKEGSFIVTLTTDMSLAHAQRMREEFKEKQHYILVAGFYEATELHDNEMAVKVHAAKMELSDELVEFVAQ
jgi:hypothetical protein